MSNNDDWLAPIPRKKRASLPASSSTSNNNNNAADADQDLRHMAIPRKRRSAAGGGGGDRGRGSLSDRGRHGSHPPQHAQSHAAGSKAERVRMAKDAPLTVRIRTKGAALSSSRSSQRQPKRTRPTYQEMELTDSDDLMSSDDEKDKGNSSAPPKKKGRLVPFRDSNNSGKAASKAATNSAAASEHGAAATGNLGPAVSGGGLLPASGVDGPPEGTLSTLWYSREVFLSVMVLEKALGWKVRPVVRLVHPTTKEPHVLEEGAALKIQQTLLQVPQFWTNPKRRVEISRITPHLCPTILRTAALEEESKAAREKRDVKFVLVQDPTATEEILFVKWRGRSHLHCSWERSMDIQRLDPTNNTVKQKIKRFFQAQETALGEDWKRVLQEERAAAAASREDDPKGGATTTTDAATTGSGAAGADGGGEEYFSAQCLEIERIMACDETEMNMDVLATQRAHNLRAEQDSLEQRDEPTTTATAAPEEHASTMMDSKTASDSVRNVALQGWRNLLAPVVKRLSTEEVWDPEDNVRYVVKWKGLPYAEITWEYWRDIKVEAVDLAEDFWYRQSPPDDETVKLFLNRTHPHMRDFKKMHESPTYGLSSRSRPIAKLDDERDKEFREEESTFKGFKLRSYQLEGVNWLLFNWWNRRSCILADEMGLGKTIQSTAFLRQLQSNESTHARGPFLIVGPLSLAGQWQSELASWAPDMNVVLYHGSADAREFLIQNEFYFNEPFVNKGTAAKLKKQHFTKFHVLITTYEVVLKDSAVLSKIRWKSLIVDEAHRLKNHKSRLFEELAAVPRDYCVLLTGTPIANATEELWALLHFANPKAFANREEFLTKFGEMTDAEQVNELHTLLRPYLLRRVKEDVEKSLPPKEETILEVSLTPIQKTFYKAIYERNTSFLFKGAKPSNAPSLMNVMMELRKCCNHPFLVKGAEDRILADAAAKWKEKNDSEANVNYTELFAEQLVKSSGKMVLMEKLLQKLFTGGHKVLIFSQMVRVLDLLEELLKLKKYRYERLDGSTSSSSRSAAVERFTRKSCQRFVMLLSTRAGGLGLNLTAADVVIIFDSDFNPQNDLQAMARAHRIGQERKVLIYRLLTAKTYEMHMFHSASLKLGLERAVMSQTRDQGEDGEEKSKKKSDKEAQAKEIDSLLKKGAYDVFRDDDDGEAEKFLEKDIDQLLEQSSKKVTYGASSTSSLGSGLGSFNKASFVADTDDGAKDVDLDDPDFWSKAVGLEAPVETPEEIVAMLDDGVKRHRKQVQVYDPYAETAEAEQRKKEKAALEKLMEKEEKERQKQEKKMKKEAAKEKKKREREEQKQQQQAAKQATVSNKGVKDEQKKAAVDAKPKKSKKSDRQRALRRAENENPVLEQLRQAWEVSQRNRASAAILRFGFGRFCKIRHESNLMSLPLQDLEIFTRAYLYQIAIQVSVSFMKIVRDGTNESQLRCAVRQWLGANTCDEEERFICDSVASSLELHREVERFRRFVRVPVVLAEPAYMTDLRKGGAFRALRRVGILSRVNNLIEDCLDEILSSLGHEELGKRGCAHGDLSSLDVDLKARFATSEELSLAISDRLKLLDSPSAPAVWWERVCDVALVLGTFVHGLGNYRTMRNDSDLPFSRKLHRTGKTDPICRSGMNNFHVACSAARKVFDDALEAARVKAELEVQAAVAAAAKAASQREEDAAVLRERGEGAEEAIKNMPETQVENAFEYDGTDSHFVTLLRMQKFVRSALGQVATGTLSGIDKTDDSTDELSTTKNRVSGLVPMPDARILDCRLLRLLEAAEGKDGRSDAMSPTNVWNESENCTVATQARNEIFLKYYGDEYRDWTNEFSGVGLGSFQCCTTHKSLNDASDYGYGSASPQLAQVAYGTDAPRYLRALGIPMNLTRFAVSALAYAESSWVEKMLELEGLRFYGDKTKGSEVNRSPLSPEDQTPRETKSIDSLSQVPSVFREDPSLRASICLTILFHGFPAPDSQDKDLSLDLVEMLPTINPSVDRLFDEGAFRVALEKITKDALVPDMTVLQEYVENTFLPHCLKLCVYGNGPSTRSARGSQGQYETALGVNVHPEISQPNPAPLPDPCVPLQEHSSEAVCHASAILRRVRLLRAAQYIVSDAVAPEVIQSCAKSKDLYHLEELPLWWNPQVHDVVLVARAACDGLFSMIPSRMDDSVFSPSVVETTIRSALFSRAGSCPPAHNSTADKADEWIQEEAMHFPSLNTIERRISYFCELVTSKGQNDSNSYQTLPMFDHGGWPRR